MRTFAGEVLLDMDTLLGEVLLNHSVETSNVGNLQTSGTVGDCSLG